MADSFEHFFKGNYNEVLQRVAAAGASPDVAAEATQEAFVRAYQRWWRVGHFKNPAAWVQRVALNCRIDLERKSQRESRPLRAVEVELVEEADADSRIETAVQTLPPQQQAAVRAVYSDGLSTEETAEDLGISAGAVRYHLSKARNALRPMLSSNTASQEAS